MTPTFARFLRQARIATRTRYDEYAVPPEALAHAMGVRLLAGAGCINKTWTATCRAQRLAEELAKHGLSTTTRGLRTTIDFADLVVRFEEIAQHRGKTSLFFVTAEGFREAEGGDPSRPFRDDRPAAPQATSRGPRLMVRGGDEGLAILDAVTADTAHLLSAGRISIGNAANFANGRYRLSLRVHPERQWRMARWSIQMQEHGDDDGKGMQLQGNQMQTAAQRTCAGLSWALAALRPLFEGPDAALPKSPVMQEAIAGRTQSSTLEAASRLERKRACERLLANLEALGAPDAIMRAMAR